VEHPYGFDGRLQSAKNAVAVSQWQLSEVQVGDDLDVFCARLNGHHERIWGVNLRDHTGLLQLPQCLTAA
jgi:hypothetical protein